MVGTDSQTINAALVGTDLQLLPENTTVSETVDLSSLAGGSGTDSQTINAALVGTDLQLLPENTTVSETVDLSKIDFIGDVLSFSNISSITIITSTSTLYTVPAGYSAEITSALPDVKLIGQNRFDYKSSDQVAFQNNWQAEFSIFINSTEIFLGHTMKYDTNSGNFRSSKAGYINARLINSRIILPEGTTISAGENIGFLNIVEFLKLN